MEAFQHVIEAFFCFVLEHARLTCLAGQHLTKLQGSHCRCVKASLRVIMGIL